MNINGQVGAPASSSAPNSQPIIRLGNLNDVIVSELHGPCYEGSYRKARFGGAMQAALATATIAGLSTTVTGTSVLYNPIGSGVNVAIERLGVAFLVAPAAPLAFGIATGWSPLALSGTLTSVAPKSKLIGSGAQPVAQLYSSASIILPVAPTVDTILGALDTGAVTVATQSAQGIYDLKGEIILPPGGYAVFYTSAVMAASGHMASWNWEEISL
jgi:hypothetical protein